MFLKDIKTQKVYKLNLFTIEKGKHRVSLKRVKRISLKELEEIKAIHKPGTKPFYIGVEVIRNIVKNPIRFCNGDLIISNDKVYPLEENPFKALVRNPKKIGECEWIIRHLEYVISKRTLKKHQKVVEDLFREDYYTISDEAYKCFLEKFLNKSYFQNVVEDADFDRRIEPMEKCRYGECKFFKNGKCEKEKEIAQMSMEELTKTWQTGKCKLKEEK